MVNFVRIFRNNEYVLLPLQDYLKEYTTQTPEGWAEMSDWLNRIYKIRNALEYKALSKELQVEDFDIRKVKKAFSKLKKEYINFDEDILMFISFLLGTTYFSKIGNPTLEEWFSAIDINHPYKKKEDLDYGFSFLDALQHEFGQNAIRKKLLSTLHWISSQGGS